MYLREATIVYGPRRGLRRSTMTSAADVAPFLRDLIADKVVEHFIVVAFDSRMRPMAWTTVAIGGVSHCPVAVSDVLRFVIVAGGGASFLIGHNHPSGDPTPSAEDLAFTKRIDEAARVVGLHLLDAIIVAEDGYCSFLDAGLLPRRGR